MTMRVVRVIVPWMLVLMLPAAAAAMPGVYRLPLIPVAYPSFSPEKTDSKTDAFTVSLLDDQGTALKGYGVSISTRSAFTDKYALDLQLGFAKGSGDIGGAAPFAPIPYTFGPGNTFLGYCTTTVAGTATGDILMAQVSMNLEYQPVRDRWGGIILFLGPSFTYQSMTAEIPYRFSFAPASFTSAVHTDTQKSNTMLLGLQIGAQAAVKVGGSAVLSPFVMVSTAAGNSSVSDKPEGAGVPGIDTTSNVSKSSATVFGVDIIVGRISFGVVSQTLKTTHDQLSSSTVDGSIVKTTTSRDDSVKMLRVGFSF